VRFRGGHFSGEIFTSHTVSVSGTIAGLIETHLSRIKLLTKKNSASPDCRKKTSA
jgi:hypothetical protein